MSIERCRSAREPNMVYDPSKEIRLGPRQLRHAAHVRGSMRAFFSLAAAVAVALQAVAVLAAVHSAGSKSVAGSVHGEAALDGWIPTCALASA